MRHQDGFKAEGKFHNALRYMCERYNGFQTKDLKQLMNILDPSLLESLFKRRECKRKLRYIGESNEHFTYGKLYSSLTFNGATYQAIDDNEENTGMGSAYFEWIG